jgi:hypothetical protein
LLEVPAGIRTGVVGVGPRFHSTGRPFSDTAMTRA